MGSARATTLPRTAAARWHSARAVLHVTAAARTCRLARDVGGAQRLARAGACSPPAQPAERSGAVGVGAGGAATSTHTGVKRSQCEAPDMTHHTRRSALRPQTKQTTRGRLCPTSLPTLPRPTCHTALFSPSHSYLRAGSDQRHAYPS
eukprot:2794956-Rhodomonas_salina.1